MHISEVPSVRARERANAFRPRPKTECERGRRVSFFRCLFFSLCAVYLGVYWCRPLSGNASAIARARCCCCMECVYGAVDSLSGAHTHTRHFLRPLSPTSARALTKSSTFIIACCDNIFNVLVLCSAWHICRTYSGHFQFVPPCTLFHTWRCAQIARSLSLCAAHKRNSPTRTKPKRTKRSAHNLHMRRLCPPRTGPLARSNECQTIRSRR